MVCAGLLNLWPTDQIKKHQNHSHYQIYNRLKIILLTLMMKVSKQLGIDEKYGLRYYSFLFNELAALFILYKTNDLLLASGFVLMIFTIISYIPISDKHNTNHSKELNKSQWVLGPLLISCFTKFFILFFLWNNYAEIKPISMFGFIFGVLEWGYLISGTIDAVHELLHRNQLICRIIAYLTLIPYQFTIYPIQHLYLHHKKVGSLEDPITSPKNQSLYKFYFKAIFSAYKFNYQYSKIIFMGCMTATIGYNILLYILADSMDKYLFFTLLSYSALLFMEGVQYIEHYGLVYRGKDDQSCQKITQICSWNTSQSGIQNWFIFRFQRHSDHHMNAYKIYSSLDLNDKMPQLPFDFISAVGLALNPSLWYSVMNPLVDQVIEVKSIDKNHQKKIKISVYILNTIAIMLFLVRVTMYIMK